MDTQVNEPINQLSHDNSDEMWARYHSKKVGSIVHALHVLKTTLVCKVFASRVLSFGSARPKSILELGCGSGSTLAELKKRTGARCVGIDRNEICLAQARSKFKDIEFVQGDLFALGIDPNSFDIVYSVGLLEHFEQSDQEKILAAHRDIAKDAYVLMTPADSWIMNSILFINKRLLKRTGTWADEEVFSKASLARKFPHFTLKAFKDFLFGNMIIWFGARK